MATIEGNHFGPVLTHNPPGPPWVMDVGWVVGWRRETFANVCLVGLGLHNVIHSLLLLLVWIIPSVNLFPCPDTTLTQTPFFIFVSAPSAVILFYYELVSLEHCLMCLPMYKTSPRNLCGSCQPQNTDSRSIYTKR